MPSPDLVLILRQLYAAEINVSIASLYDAGWTVKIGDEINGYTAEATFRHDEFDRIAEWLAEKGGLYPGAAND